MYKGRPNGFVKGYALFTPKESGYYTIYLQSEAQYLSLSVDNPANHVWIDDIGSFETQDGSLYRYRLDSGVTYLLSIYAQQEDEALVTLSASKEKNATSFSVNWKEGESPLVYGDDGSYSGSADSGYEFSFYRFTVLDKFIFTATYEDGSTGMDYQEANLGVNLSEEPPYWIPQDGSMIACFSYQGFTATLEVAVNMPYQQYASVQDLKLDTWVTSTSEPYGEVMFTFTPPKTGYYAFTCKTTGITSQAEGYPLLGDLYTKEWDEVKKYDFSTDPYNPNRILIPKKKLKGGIIYYLRLLLSGYEYGADYEVYVQKTSKPIKLQRPAQPHTTNQKNGVLLTWDAVPHASGYRIHRWTNGFTESGWIGETKELSFLDTSPTKGKTCWYSIEALAQQEGNTWYVPSSLSYRVKNCFLGRVSTPSATSKNSAVTLSWKKVTRAGGYEIRYGTNKEDGLSQVLVSNDPTVEIPDLERYESYYFSVRAFKTVNQQTYYGVWSKWKKVKVK